jgi:serine/threonine protein kinase
MVKFGSLGRLPGNRRECREKPILDYLNGEEVLQLFPIQQVDGFEQCDLPYMITEKVGEISLENIIDHEVSLSTGFRMVERLFYIVKSLRERGIFHKDLDAGNILLTICDPVNFLRIIDLAIPSRLSSRILSTCDAFTEFPIFFLWELLDERCCASAEEWNNMLQKAAELLLLS